MQFWIGMADFVLSCKKKLQKLSYRANTLFRNRSHRRPKFAFYADFRSEGTFKKKCTEKDNTKNCFFQKIPSKHWKMVVRIGCSDFFYSRPFMPFGIEMEESVFSCLTNTKSPFQEGTFCFLKRSTQVPKILNFRLISDLKE
jgi:hypothetical protein